MKVDSCHEIFFFYFSNRTDFSLEQGEYRIWKIPGEDLNLKKGIGPILRSDDRRMINTILFLIVTFPYAYIECNVVWLLIVWELSFVFESQCSLIGQI